MDENSREGETSERKENPENDQRTKEAEDGASELASAGVRIEPVSGSQEVRPAVGPSLDESGKSSKPEEECAEETSRLPTASDNDDDDDDDDDEGDAPTSLAPTAKSSEPREILQGLSPTVEQPTSVGKPIIGPPPSYSFVMNQKTKFFKQRRSLTPVNERIPPPAYTGMQRSYPPPGESQRFCNLASFSEPMWRSHSQPAFCPRCGIIILTTTHSHDSVSTHVAALALCLFGCWPCCLIPYCMSTCKNTYHHCPICQTFLGSYAPW